MIPRFRAKSDPEEVKSLQDVDESAVDESLLPMRISDTLSQRVEDELETVLQEARDSEEDNNDAY